MGETLVSFLLFFSLAIPALAVYSPGQTLDPTCLPSDPSCYVDNTLFPVTGITLGNGTSSPATTTDQLYNVGGLLYWDGSPVAGATGLTLFNGQNGAVQVLATSSNNGGWGFTSTSSTHTLNIPTASASNPLGLLSNTDWNIFSNKLSTSSINASAKLLAIVGDATGTGALVFNNAPTFTGGVTINGTASTTGPELITNGSFTGNASGWTLQSECSVYGANHVTVTYDSTCISDQNWPSLATNFPTVAGSTYLLTFTIATATQEQAYMYFNHNPTYIHQGFGKGTHTITFTASYTGTETIYFDAWEYFNGGVWVLDDVSIKKVSVVQPVAIFGNDGRAFFSANTDILSTALGSGALANSSIFGSANTAIGYDTLFSNVSGAQNVAMGNNALYSNVSGGNNLAIGTDALFYNNASYNVAIGNLALTYNTTGVGNTANGFATLYSNSTGNYNTANGYDALIANTSGTGNVASGFLSLRFTTTGGYNTALGYQTGLTNTVGTSTTFIGANADALLNNLSSATAIGAGALVGCSNCMVLGGTGANAVNVGIGTSSPQTFLSVNGAWVNTNNRGNLEITSTDYDSAVGLTLNQSNPGVDQRNWGLVANFSRDGVFQFMHGSTSTGSALVTPGVTVDALGDSLSINNTNSLATLYAQGTSANASKNLFTLASSTGTTLFNVTSAGNVGIGTTTPGAKFSIDGDASGLIDLFSIGSSTSGVATSSTFFRVAATGRTLLTGATVDPAVVAVVHHETDDFYDVFGRVTAVAVQGKYAYTASENRGSLAVTDISDPTHPVVVGETQGPLPYDTLDGAADVAVSGHYAYVVTGGMLETDNSGSGSLVVVDISNPSAPHYVSQWTYEGLENPNAISVVGKYAYVADRNANALFIFDISDPAHIRLMSTEQGPTPGTSLWGAGDVSVVGNYAYVAVNYRNSLAVIDISNPADPVFVSEERGPVPDTSLNQASSVFVSGHLAYVTRYGYYNPGMAIIDIANPANPVFLSDVTGPTPGTTFAGATDVYVAGNYAYVTAMDRYSLAVVDVSSSTNPRFVAEERGSDPGNTTFGGPTSVVVSGNYAYVTDYYGDSLVVVDVGALDTPTANIGSLTVDDLFVQNGAIFGQNLSVAGGFTAGSDALISGALTVGGTASSSLLSSNLTNALSVVSGRVTIGTTTLSSFANASSTKLLLSGGALVQQQAASSTYIVGGVKDDTNLAGANSITISGKYAYVANYNDDSLRIIDIGNPASPVIVGGIKDASLLNGANSVAISGKYAYVANINDHSLRIIDISNPTSLIIVGGIKDASLLSGAWSVTISGKYAYVLNLFDNSLRIIDISNPASPVMVGGIKDDSLLNGEQTVTISGKYAYVAVSNDSSLRIIDIGNPASPVMVGGIKNASLLNGASSVAISGKYAYVTAYSDNSLRIIDISNPASPVMVGGIKDNTNLFSPNSVAISGKYAYVANQNDNSLRIIDVSSSTNPVIVGGIKDDSLLSGAAFVTISGKYAYMANAYDNSLRIIDIGGIDSPAAHIGSIFADSINVSQNLTVAGQGYFGGLNVGPLGFLSGGTGTFSTEATTSLSATPALSVLSNDNSAASILDVLSLSHTATGTIANGIGTGLLFNTEYTGSTAASTTATSTARIAAVFTDASVSTPASALVFYTKNGTSDIAERMRLSATGNLGIGSTTPLAKLTVQANVGDTNTLIFSVASSSVSSTTTFFTVDRIGNVSAPQTLATCGGIQTNGNGVMSCTSDERLKNISGPYNAGLDAILKIEPQTYTWKEGTPLFDNNVPYSGFIAQNVQEALSEAVTTNKAGFLQVNQTTILAAAVNAIKELAHKVDDLASAISGFAQSFTTRELCVADQSGAKTCLTKSELDTLMDKKTEQSGGTQSVHTSPPPTVDTPPVPPSETSTPTSGTPPAPVIDPAPDTPPTPPASDSAVPEPQPEPAL